MAAIRSFGYTHDMGVPVVNVSLDLAADPKTSPGVALENLFAQLSRAWAETSPGEPRRAPTTSARKARKARKVSAVPSPPVLATTPEVGAVEGAVEAAPVEAARRRVLTPRPPMTREAYIASLRGPSARFVEIVRERHPEPVSQDEVASLLGVPPRTLGGVVGSLLRWGREHQVPDLVAGEVRPSGERMWVYLP